MTESRHLVIGAGGLLGSAVFRRLGSAATRASVPWGRPEAREILSRIAREHLASVPQDEPWKVMWCAGAGVNGTSDEALACEVEEFRAFVTTLADAGADHPGGLFLASSAGGVYAGSTNPPFTEHHPTAPLSSYGSTKLVMESVAREAFASSPHTLAVGRIANLYGPGQNLTKMQGLISHICRALSTDQPLNLFVPIDTIRDYIYVDDAADMVLALLDTALERGMRDVTKIIASGRGATIGELIGLAHALSKRRPPVVYASSPLASFQSSDLRLRSMVLPELDACARTPLDVGIASTAQAVMSLRHAGTLA